MIWETQARHAEAALRARWAALPRWARVILAVYLIGFTDGTCAHAIALIRDGVHDYSGFRWVPFQVFFNSLGVLDPLVAVLAALARREAIWLGLAIMLLDVPANLIGNWSWLQADPARFVHPGGLWLITVFGLFVYATCVPMLRIMPRDHPLATAGMKS